MTKEIMQSSLRLSTEPCGTPLLIFFVNVEVVIYTNLFFK